jgi:type VI secretion system protein ImpJ
MKEQQLISSAIQWHDGMILGPQHFQEAFFRSEDIFHYYTRELIPFSYGFTKYKIDEGALTSGILSILEVQGVMPDGIDFCYDPKKDKALSLELAPFKEELSKKVLTLYISIPLQGTSHSISMDELSRYRESKAESTFDQNLGGEELEIPRIRPRIKLFLSELPPPHHVSMPLVKIFEDGTLFRLKAYVPPLLKVKKDSPLWQECMETSIKIRQKIQIVIDDLQRMRTLSQQQYKFDKYFTIHALALAIPRFEAIYKTEEVHPFMVHLEFLSLLGAIFTIDQNITPPVSVEYAHDDIMEGYQKIKKLIFEILDREIPSNYQIVPFTKINNDFKFILNEPITKGADIVIGFRKPFNVKNEDFSNWIKTVIVGDAKKFEILRQKRLLGLPRKIVEKYDELIPQRNMFLIVCQNTEEDIKEGESLMLAQSVSQNFTFVPDEVVFYRKIKT